MASEENHPPVMDFCGHKQTLNKQKLCLCGCGCCCLLPAVVVAALWSSIFLFFLSWQFALSQRSITFNMWKETPLPMYMNVVLFNWTNPEQSLRGPEKPILTEMGPYVFSEHHSKQNIVWNDDNSTITFQNRNEWHFMENMSSGSLSDIVTNLNTVALTLGSRCQHLGNLTGIVNEIFERNGSLVVSKSVGDLIFDGYKDALLQNTDLRRYLPDFPGYDRFGWYYQRNMSATFDGEITMHTGQKDIERLGLLTSWNYRTSTGCYPGECGQVKSTIGNVLPLSTFKQLQFTLFNTDICGVYTLESEKLVELNNIPGVQYQATQSMFSNKETCYCPNKTCPASGVRDISACKHAPLFISLPHFLHADPSYMEAVRGLQPNASKHSFFMSLANLTSVPLVVQVRLQTNLLVEPIPNMTFFSNLSRLYMPMYWVDQYAILTPDLAALMHPLYPFSEWGGWGILLFGGGLGAILILLGFILRCQDTSETTSLLSRGM
uniref:Scavenger receptor class B member 1 n=1 Tax=Graphocephala atropunctata TaxID=36148 RepID=A0A1B6MBF3_9HEMI